MLNQQNKNYILVFLFILIFLSSAAADDGTDDVFIFEFEDIVIEDLPVEVDTNLMPAQITVFDKEMIEASGARTVADVVERAPGVVVSRQGGILEPQSVSIRGGSSDHVLVLLDGKPADSLWTGAADPGGISVSDIERIEIIRGASAAIYGEGAVSGVINIITAEKEAVDGRAEFEYGLASFNTHQLNMDLSGCLSPDAGLSGGLSAAALYTGGGYAYELSSEDLQRLNNDGWAADASASLRGSSFSAGAGFSASEKGTPGVMEFLTPNSRIQNIRGSAGLDFDFYSENAGTFNAEAGYLYNFSAYTNPDKDLKDSNENSTAAVSGRWMMDFELNEIFLAASVSAGYSFDYLSSTALTDSTGSSIGGDALQHAADIRGSLSLEYGRFDLIPAAGIDWILTEYSAVNPLMDFALSWSTAVGWSPLRTEFQEGPVYLKINAGTAYKNPSFQDLFWPSGALAAGNPDLLPEKGLNFDGGLFITLLAVDEEISAQIEAVGFFSIARDLIQWLPSAGGVWRPVNLGIVQSSGLEFAAEVQCLKLFEPFEMTLNVVYNWLKTIDADHNSINYGRQLAYRPGHSGNLSMRFTHPDYLSFEVSGNYLGYRFTNNANTKFIDHVLLLSASLQYDFNETFRVSASVENILNRIYIDRLGYPVPGIQWYIKGRVRI